MAESSRFFADTTEYPQVQMAEALASFADGYRESYLNELEVTESSPQAMSVDLDTGAAWVQGYFYSNSASYTLAIAAADGSNPRIDTVVLRLSPLSAQSVIAAVLTGTPAATPAAPTLTQDATTYEIALYDVAVGTGVTTILNANLTDRRSIGGIGTASVPSADESTEGIIRKATTAEAEAGVSTVGALTPETGKEMLDALRPDLTSKYCFLALATDQTSGSTVLWDTESPAPLTDPSGWHDNSTNKDRITVDADGTYSINCSLFFNNSSLNGTSQFTIGVNGTVVYYSPPVYTSSNGYGLFGGCDLQLSASDYITVGVSGLSGTHYLYTFSDIWNTITVQRIV